MDSGLKKLASEISLEGRIAYAIKMFYVKQVNPEGGTPFEKLSEKKEAEIKELTDSLNEEVYKWKQDYITSHAKI